jgi:ADP-heptose:LPS heptosyltransferase
MKILVFKIGMMGDIIMSTPFLRQLRKNYKNAEIEYLVGKSSANVLEENPNINRIIEFDESMFFKKRIIKWIKLTKDLRKKNYDKIFVLDKHWLPNIIAYFFGGKEIVGFYRKNNWFNLLDKKVFFGPIRHEILYFLDLLSVDCGKADYTDLKTELFFNEDIKYSCLPEDYIVIINSGGKNISEDSQLRMMPDGLFIDLVKKISKKNKVFLLGNRDDSNYYAGLNFLNENIQNRAGVSFKESLIIMKQARMIITTDCGAMHMAGAVNENLICVFGPTHPKRKLPFGENTKYIWQDENIYTSDYEVFRKNPPKNIFMKKIEAVDILKYLN